MPCPLFVGREVEGDCGHRASLTRHSDAMNSEAAQTYSQGHSAGRQRVKRHKAHWIVTAPLAPPARGATSSTGTALTRGSRAVMDRRARAPRREVKVFMLGMWLIYLR